MKVTYAILATVSLQHDYYADGRCPDFEITPSAVTAGMLKGLGILTKTVGNTLILLIKVKDDGSTFLQLPQDVKLTFYLQLVLTNFVNYTNLPFQSNAVFYLTNLYQNEQAGTLFLNRPVPAFSNATAYAIGSLAAAGGKIYESVKPVAPGDPAPGDAAFWYLRSGAQYVNDGDGLLLSDGNLKINTAPAKAFDISVFSLNAASADYGVPAWSQRQSFPQDVAVITVNLDLPPAKYRVVVNGTDHFVYVDKAATYARVSGILELYNPFPATDDFGWLDAAGVPKGTDYVIRFANRLAIWKYITRTTNVTTIENTAAPGTFAATPNPRQFVSLMPLPLQQTPLKTIQVKHNATVLGSRLANPPPERIATYTDPDGNTYYCAEMYVNY